MSTTKRTTTQRSSRARDSVLLGLLSGKTIGEIASATGLNRSTIWRIRNDPQFQERLAAARAEAFEDALNGLHSNATIFVAALADVATDPRAKDSARAMAAKSGLDSLFHARENYEFERRLQALEKQTTGEGEQL